jgi:hypothetical protein
MKLSKRLTKENRVSLAWALREGPEKYIAEKWPLFAQTG